MYAAITISHAVTDIAANIAILIRFFLLIFLAFVKGYILLVVLAVSHDLRAIGCILELVIDVPERLSVFVSPQLDSGEEVITVNAFHQSKEEHVFPEPIREILDFHLRYLDESRQPEPLVTRRTFHHFLR